MGKVPPKIIQKIWQNIWIFECKNVEVLRKVICLIVRRGYRVAHMIHGYFSDDEKEFEKIIDAILSSV